MGACCPSPQLEQPPQKPAGALPPLLSPLLLHLCCARAPCECFRPRPGAGAGEGSRRGGPRGPTASEGKDRPESPSAAKPWSGLGGVQVPQAASTPVPAGGGSPSRGSQHRQRVLSLSVPRCQALVGVFLPWGGCSPSWGQSGRTGLRPAPFLPILTPKGCQGCREMAALLRDPRVLLCP